MITLNGTIYRTALDHAGQLVALRWCGRAWRIAGQQDTIRVLAELHRPAIVH